MIRRLGITLIALGIISLIVSLSLTGYYTVENSRVEEKTQSVIKELKKQVKKNETTPESQLKNKDKQIDTYNYYGYITIPSLNLELPVMEGCDYARLDIAPCRYYGTIEDKNLVIAAHSYSCHFGNLSYINIGDKVYFTDMTNKVYKFVVRSIEELPPQAVNDMINSEWDLTLYTCNFNGSKRVTIRCEEF